MATNDAISPHATRARSERPTSLLLEVHEMCTGGAFAHSTIALHGLTRMEEPT